MKSMNCGTWEEQMYWKNFHFARFSLILPSNFHRRLVLPKKFTDHMRMQLPKKVTLKVNGVTWNANLEKDKDDVMLQGDGWEEFAKAYSLNKSDMLIFTYNRHECFEVLLFDQANLCEKEASYFVRKGQQPNFDVGDAVSGETKENSAEEFTDRNQGHGDSVYTLRSRLRKNFGRTYKEYSSDGYDEDERDETSDEENSMSVEDCTNPKKAATERVTEVPSNLRKRNYKVADKTTPKKRTRCAETCYRSNRRPVTEAEKEKALEKAREASAQYRSSFIVVMRPSSVYKRFYMSIPKEWKVRRVFKKGQEVILSVKDKTWGCTVRFTRYNGAFEGGWEKFARENFLEEFDVCLFVPITSSKGGRPVLDVTIFRVISEAVQPRPIIPSYAEVNEISSEDISQGDYGSACAYRNRHRKSSATTPEGHSSGRNAHDKDPRELDVDVSSDEEKSSTDDEKLISPRSRRVPFNSWIRKHYVAGKTTPKENGGYCESSARQITEADKERVLVMAQETAAKYTDSFISIMRPSCVGKRFFMSITKDWKLRRDLRKGEAVFLQVKDKTWACTFCSTTNNVGLQGGWKCFALENKLEEFDVCMFVPAEQKNSDFVLDVTIFRVRPGAV